MARRQYTREFTLEAVRLIKERGVSVVQAARDLEVGENVLRRWAKQVSGDPQHVFPGQAQMKPEQLERERAGRGRSAFAPAVEFQAHYREINNLAYCIALPRYMKHTN